MKKYILLFIIIVFPVFSFAQEGAKSKKPGSKDKNGNERVNTEESVESEESVKETTSNYEDVVENFSSNIFIENIEVEKIELYQYSFEGVYPIIKGIPNKDLENEINQTFINNYKDYYQRSKNRNEFIHADVSFEILTLSDNLISIIQYGHWQYGDGNGHGSDAYVVNADLQKNKILTNDDLNINEIDLKTYNNRIFDYFKQNELLWDNEGYDPMDYYYKSDDDICFIPVVKNHQELNEMNFGIKENVLQLVEYSKPGARATHYVYVVPLKIQYLKD